MLYHSCSNKPLQCSAPLLDLTLTEEESSDNIGEPRQRWMKCGDVELSMQHRNIIASGAWLDDLIVSAVQNLLKKQYPYIGGFLNTVLSENLSMPPQAGEFI